MIGIRARDELVVISNNYPQNVNCPNPCLKFTRKQGAWSQVHRGSRWRLMRSDHFGKLRERRSSWAPFLSSHLCIFYVKSSRLMYLSIAARHALICMTWVEHYSMSWRSCLLPDLKSIGYLAAMPSLNSTPTSLYPSPISSRRLDALTSKPYSFLRTCVWHLQIFCSDARQTNHSWPKSSENVPSFFTGWSMEITTRLSQEAALLSSKPKILLSFNTMPDKFPLTSHLNFTDSSSSILTKIVHLFFQCAWHLGCWVRRGNAYYTGRWTSQNTPQLSRRCFLQPYFSQRRLALLVEEYRQLNVQYWKDLCGT